MDNNQIKYLLATIVRSFKEMNAGAKIRALEDIQQEFLNSGFTVEYFEGPWKNTIEDFMTIARVQDGIKVITISPKITFEGKTIVSGFVKEAV